MHFLELPFLVSKQSLETQATKLRFASDTRRNGKQSFQIGVPKQSLGTRGISRDTLDYL
jgi:hypothetical protein